MIGACRLSSDATKLSRSLGVDHFALGLRGDLLEQLAIGRQAIELVGQRLGGPTHFALAHALPSGAVAVTAAR